MKPIRIFRSPLTGSYFALRTYIERPNGDIENTGLKEDVSADIEAIVAERIAEHLNHGARALLQEPIGD